MAQGNPKGLKAQGWGRVESPMLVCGEPEMHGDFEGKVYHVRRTHISSSTSAIEPSASPSPSDTMWCRGVVPWGQSSTALN